MLGWVGKPVTQFFPDLIRLHPEIATVTVVIYRPAPVLADRLIGGVDPGLAIRTRAEVLNREHGIGFWDAVLAIGMREGQLPEQYVELALLHDSAAGERELNLSRDEVSTGGLSRLIGSLDLDYGLSVSSRVQLDDGRQAHIPMMDFRCQHSDANLEIIKRALVAMGQSHGALVQSSRSYHFYGLGLLAERAWLRFLGMSILFSPIADVRYIGHRLADGACRLRLSAAANRGDAPRVVAVFQ